MKKMKFALVAIICLSIVFIGFIQVNTNLPEFIRNKSSVIVNYTLRPFDFRIVYGDYAFYINTKIFTNLKDEAAKVFKNIEQGSNFKENKDQ